MGAMAAGERMLSTHSRNFPGPQRQRARARCTSPSAATAAASAALGRIADPREATRRAELVFRGRCWTVGDYVPTDQIVKSARVFEPMEVIARHVLEDANPRVRGQA